MKTLLQMLGMILLAILLAGFVFAVGCGIISDIFFEDEAVERVAPREALDAALRRVNGEIRVLHAGTRDVEDDLRLTDLWREKKELEARVDALDRAASH